MHFSHSARSTLRGSQYHALLDCGQYDWIIFHDRLTQWWEKECQEYIRQGWRVRAFAGTGSESSLAPATQRSPKTTSAQSSPFGDSPKLHPLDSSLFPLVKDCVRELCSVTHHRCIGAEDKWSMGPWQVLLATHGPRGLLHDCFSRICKVVKGGDHQRR